MKTMLKIAARLFPLLMLLMAQPASAFYDSQAQRWVNRDPIGENGGINLYGFVHNNSV